MLLTLLLVHHEEVMRSLLIRAVQACGVPVNHVYQAANAAEAVGILHATSVDVVLLDATAAESGANELLVRSTHAETPSVGIVVMSADPAAFKASILGGAVTVVATPCAPGDLRAGILAALTDKMHRAGALHAP